MTTNTNAQPRIVSREQWLVERKKHLTHEKELTKQLDQLRAERRRLPMVKVEGTMSLKVCPEKCVCSTCSRDADSSSFITLCSTRTRTKAVRVARS